MEVILKEQHKQYAQLIGTENLIKLSRAYGGTSIYIPKEEELLREQKYRELQKAFTGDNIKELAMQYHVSERTVYRIVKDTMKARKTSMAGQISLFDSN